MMTWLFDCNQSSYEVKRKTIPTYGNVQMKGGKNKKNESSDSTWEEKQCRQERWWDEKKCKNNKYIYRWMKNLAGIVSRFENFIGYIRIVGPIEYWIVSIQPSRCMTLNFQLTALQSIDLHRRIRFQMDENLHWLIRKKFLKNKSHSLRKISLLYQ